MTLAKLATGTLLAAVLAVGPQTRQELKDLRAHVGQTQRVCGLVANYHSPAADGTGDCSVQLDIGDAKSKFHVLVPNDAAPAFPTPVELMYGGSTICVTGTIEREKRNVFRATITSPRQIQSSDPPHASFGAGAHRSCEAGIKVPALRKEVKPAYTSSMRAQGSAYLDAVVGSDGGVTDVRTLSGRYPDINAQVEAAVRQWRFSPGTLSGKPVPVLVMIQMDFSLH